MEKEKQNNQEQWLKAFVDREEDFDYEAFCEMMRSPDNEDLREEFERVRRLTVLEADKAKMWKQVQSRMNKNSRYRVKRYLKYAAIIVAFVLAGGTWWLCRPEKCCRFAEDSHKIGTSCRADVGIGPYRPL